MKLFLPKRKQTHYLIVIICCCCLTTCSVGNAFNCAGLFYSPISQELDVGIGQVAFYITIASLISGLAAPFAIKCFEIQGTTPVLSCATLVSVGCYLLLSRANNIALLYFCGIFLGISTSFYGIPVAAYFISNWFEAKYEVVTGIVFSFSGLGGALLNPLYSAVMEKVGWRNTYLCSALIVFVLLLPSCLLLQKDPACYELPKYRGNSKVKKQDAVTGAEKEKAGNVNVKFVLVICCVVGFLGFFVTTYATHFKTYIISLGIPTVVGVTMTTLAMISNSAGKFTAGILCEKMGGLNTALLMLFFGILGVFILCISPVPALVFYLSAFLVGAVFSVPSVCLSAVGKTFFDGKAFASLYSVVQVFASFGSASGYFCIGKIYDITGSYKASSVLCLGFLLLSFLLMVILLISYKKFVHKTITMI